MRNRDFGRGWIISRLKTTGTLASGSSVRKLTGYRLAAPEKASAIVIEAESFSCNPASRGKFTRTGGFPAAIEAKRLGISGGGDSV